MCGIFGFVGAPGAVGDNPSIQQAVRSLIRLSEPRGREATGVALSLPDEIAVYRRPMAPSRVLEHPGFQRFLDEALPEAAAPAAGELAMVGHCRLVTNGSQAIEANNQPVLHRRVVGVHNGIVTNPGALLEAVGEHEVVVELDSEALFRHLAGLLEAGLAVEAALRETFARLEGEASIAMLAREEHELVLATNSGCLYYAHAPDMGILAFASEAYILRTFLDAGHLGLAPATVRHLEPGHGLRVPLGTREVQAVDLEDRGAAPSRPCSTPPASPGPPRPRPVVERTHAQGELRRCSKCILPATHPFIEFDADGVCNLCHEHVTQRVHGRDALLRELEHYRRSDGSPDCIVAFSGGRDSSYGLHLLKAELGMHPIAFTYDWGLVTDLARRNQARLCGALGVEHVIRAANIPAQRRYIRKNLDAWLARPRLGMIPIFMAGDKFFYSHARELRRETGIELVVFCAGNDLERTPFKTGFAGVRENNYSNRLFGLDMGKKLQLAAYYAGQFLANPRYVNESLANSFRSFHATFVGVDDFLYLYNYEPWDEETINQTLVSRYNWETSPESSNTWRIGDGYTAFINYVYHRVAGFSEYDAFRSHQIRDGVLDRDTALRLVVADNRPRLGELREFARLIGFNLEEVLSRVDEIPKVRPRA